MARSIRVFKALPKVFNYLKYKLLKRSELMKVSRYSPQIASLIITKRCNMACSFCSAGTIMQDGRSEWKKSELTLERVKEIFSNTLFKNALLVDLLGGEPLMVRELDDIVAYLNQEGHLTNTSTNGIKLKERIVSLKRSGISRINVSYYHENKELLERDIPYINSIFPVHMSYVLMRKEIIESPEKIIEIVRFAYKSKCKSLRFFMYRPMGLDPNLEEIISENDPAYLNLKSKIDSEFEGFVSWPAVFKPNPSSKLCPQLWQRVGTSTLGEMSICCGLEDFLKGDNSNLFSNSPDVVFNHPTLVDMRKKLLDPDSEPPEPCKNCNLLNEAGW